MTILPTQPAELTASECRACGACCSFSPEWPRFSLESDADLDRIGRAGLSMRPRPLFIGSAGLARAIARTLPRVAPAKPEGQGHSLF